MTWTLAASGTKTPMIPTTGTFTNGSANISITNTLAAGDIVQGITTTGTLPTNFALLTRYYVIAANLSGSVINLSATPGGSAITAGSAGSGTHTLTLEHVLATDTNNATFVFEADTSAVTNTDLVELRAYGITLTGGATGQMWKGTAGLVQVNPRKACPPVASDISFSATLCQRSGTARAIPWKILRV